MSQRVLVIGGTGMLGEPVVRSLAAAGHPVRVLSRHPERGEKRFEGVAELVPGDVDDGDSLARAMSGCGGVHLNLDGAGDWDLERRGALAVSERARAAGVQRISLISGASTLKQNAWFPMTAAKLAAEEAVRGSGIAFSIFRCSMFMETLPKFVRDGRAMIMGYQPQPWQWLAARDYAAMVARAYEVPEAAGKIFHLRGPQALRMAQAVETYQRLVAPETKVTFVPFSVLRVMSWMPRHRELREVGLPLMRYFSKVGESGDPSEANALLGAPTTTLEEWCRERAARK